MHHFGLFLLTKADLQRKAHYSDSIKTEWSPRVYRRISNPYTEHISRTASIKVVVFRKDRVGGGKRV